jgi:hypothetical protein
LLGDEELFLPFSEFPWFRDAAIGTILHVELPSPNHLYWRTWMSICGGVHPASRSVVSRPDDDFFRRSLVGRAAMNRESRN